nr:DUF1345 domain-containing protein [Deinococcus planocerae]
MDQGGLGQRRADLAGLDLGFSLRSPPERTQPAAAAADPGRAAGRVMVLISSLVSLVASAIVIEHATRLEPGAPPPAIAVAVVAVLSGRYLTSTISTLRSAHLSCDDGNEEAGPDGGLAFPKAPSTPDLVHFAFVVTGLTFQVSDVSTSSPVIRRLTS